MKKKLDCNEEYPVWTLLNDEASYPARVVDIPEDKIKWIENTLAEYYKVQNYLVALMKEEQNKENNLERKKKNESNSNS